MTTHKEALKSNLTPERYNKAIEVLDDQLIETTDINHLTGLLQNYSAAQVRFILAKDKKLNILSGSVRSGKTYVTLFKFCMRILASPRSYKYLMVGHSITSLERNCLEDIQNYFGHKNFTYSTNKKRAYLYGHEIFLEGAPTERSKDQIQGLTLNGAYVDEAQNVPQSFFDMLVSRLSGENAFLYASCNPAHPQHWFYVNYIKNEELLAGGMLNFYNFLLTDNIYLSDDYIRLVQSSYSGVFYQRMILGEWKAAEGVVFANFANNTEVYLTDLPEESDIDFIIMGLDFGGNKSKTAIVATAFLKNRNDGIVIVQSKHIEGGKGEITPDTVSKESIDFYLKLRQIYNKVRIPYFFCDSAEQYMINGIRADFKNQGIPVKVGDALKEKIINRIRFISRMFSVKKIKIVRTCATMISCLSELVWDDKQLTEDVLLDNGTTDNDTWDAFSYTFERYMNIYFKEYKEEGQ